MRETMIEIDNITKTYRLGTIGGGTLKGDIQSFWARLRHKDDPNLRIGEKGYKKNEKFTALDGVSFDVKKGETIGLIGRNGAGKSTLLKLLSRVTAPTEGEIRIKGKISSMLEVGTGFHPELTGRENVYLNGAILGMSRKEVDERIEDIIEFSECRQFIDTPVKRYSSGMFVKLAFSVAAHLNSDIMLMDEVLAVGDMAFQKKCLDKMRAAAKEEGRTVLYVSHNMNTIRQLCDRCIVLDKGKVIFEGDVESAIEIYMNRQMNEDIYRNYEDSPCAHWITKRKVKLLEAQYAGKDTIRFEAGEPMKIRLKWKNLQDVQDIGLRIEVYNLEDVPQATYVLNRFYSGKEGDVVDMELQLDTEMIMDAEYKTFFTFFEKDPQGNNLDIEWNPGLCFNKTTITAEESWVWQTKQWGHIQLPAPRITKLG